MTPHHQKNKPMPTTLREIEPDEEELQADSPVEGLESELSDATSTLANYEIVSIPADYTLEGLTTKWRRKQLLIPGFQRKFVWTQRQASRLIESFLLGLPVPALFLYTDPDTGAQQVIDGQQRLMSVVQFFDGQFRNAAMTEPRLFKLVGLGEASPYAGCTSKDLEDRHGTMFAKLNDAVMRAFVIKQLDPNDSTSIYHIFERLNTGGTRLLGQEIRNCVYHGTLNDLLCKLNGDVAWRQIIGVEKCDARMRDVEMILRFVALYFFANEYRKPMKDFLSTSMRKKRNLSEQDSAALTKLFRDTCNTIRKHLGAKPFHRRAGMNPAVFDSVFTTLAKNPSAIAVDLKKRFEQLLTSKQFEANASYRTTDPDAVKGRLELAHKELIAVK